MTLNHRADVESALKYAGAEYRTGGAWHVGQFAFVIVYYRQTIQSASVTNLAALKVQTEQGIDLPTSAQRTYTRAMYTSSIIRTLLLNDIAAAANVAAIDASTAAADQAHRAANLAHYNASMSAAAPEGTHEILRHEDGEQRRVVSYGEVNDVDGWAVGVEEYTSTPELAYLTIDTLEDQALSAGLDRDAVEGLVARLQTWLINHP